MTARAGALDSQQLQMFAVVNRGTTRECWVVVDPSQLDRQRWAARTKAALREPTIGLSRDNTSRPVFSVRLIVADPLPSDFNWRVSLRLRQSCGKNDSWADALHHAQAAGTCANHISCSLRTPLRRHRQN